MGLKKQKNKKTNYKDFDYEAVLLEDKVPVSHRTVVNKDLEDFEVATTIWDFITISAAKYADLKCLGKRKLCANGSPLEFVYDTFSETFVKINNLASGLNAILRDLNASADSKGGAGESPPAEIPGGSQEKSADEIREEGEQSEDGKSRVAAAGEAGSEDVAANDSRRAGEQSLGGSEKEAKVGIYSVNRPEWLMTALATQSFCGIVVPLYDSLGANAVSYAINHSNTRVVVCSKDKVESLLRMKEEGDSRLEVIIQMDFDPKYNNLNETLSQEQVDNAKALGVKLLGFSSVLQLGKEKLVGFTPARPVASDLAYIMYTSGTSGTPKGVLLTHTNAVFVCKNALKIKIFFQIEMGEQKGSYFSFLPLAHIFETAIELAVLVNGSHIAYYSGTIQNLASDLTELRPTYMCGVPRIFEKIYTKTMEKIEEKNFLLRGFIRSSFRKAVEQKRHRETFAAAPPFDGMIWSKIRRQLGFDNLRVLITGGAPCPNHIFEFLRVLIRGDVYQGYGLTETFAVTTVSCPDDINIGHCGLPIGCEIKLEAVPEMKYFPDGELKQGELCIRGPNIFVGYYKDEALTREVLVDGWFHTGDIARINPNNNISIIDRKKSLFKLSQGEYISPELLENTYSMSAAVNQIFVYGDSLRNFVVAVVVPDAGWVVRQLEGDGSALAKSAADHLRSGTNSLLAKDLLEIRNAYQTKLKDAVFAELEKSGQKLQGFERVRKVHLEFEVDSMLAGFNVENECLTPSFKLRRTFLFKRYKDDIDRMYSEGGN